MKKRMLCLFISAVLLFGCCGVQAFAEQTDTYSDLITDILARYESGSAAADTPLHEQVSDAYCLAELFALIATKRSNSAKVTDAVHGILNDLEKSDKTAKGAEQQLVNGMYRCVELLMIMVKEMDADGKYGDRVSAIIEEFNSGNKSAASAAQQVVNGLYRCVDFLTLIAMENSSSSSQTEHASAIHASLIAGLNSSDCSHSLYLGSLAFFGSRFGLALIECSLMHLRHFSIVLSIFAFAASAAL